MQAAAAIGDAFKIRPSVVLDDGLDEFPMLVDLAAAEYLADQQRKADEKANRKSGGISSRAPTRRARRR